MQVAPRRVKSIYSVIASPQRLEILKILNTKGPLTYSTLKTLAGFKSKKESGKFAYHLRKLVRVMLVQLNRQERKYTVTNFGRMVLNVTRQIEEQTQVESGKLYVRTSRQTMEEFNANKIMQSLIKEANMPVELAQKITSEAESRIYKFQTQYLTAPLIREIVNSVLIEQNHEEYRHKLSRLGMPVYDVTQLFGKAGEDGFDVESLIHETGKSVLSEYLLLEQLPRDVSDSHLAGDINISNPGTWGLLPDVVFIDLLSLKSSGFNTKGRIKGAPIIPNPGTLEDAVNSLTIFSSLTRKEVSDELFLKNLISYISAFSRSKTKKEIESMILKTFENLAVSSCSNDGASITFHLTISRDHDSSIEVQERVLDSTLDAYKKYVDETPEPKIRLILSLSENEQQHFYKKAVNILVGGGKIAFSAKNQTRSFAGINATHLPPEINGDNICFLGNLSLNLPRLAYESNQDETYFRAKLAMLISTGVSALSSRKKIIERNFRRGLLPSLLVGTETYTSESMPMLINLVGMDEALRSLGKDMPPQSHELVVKIAETASEKLKEKTTKTEKYLASMIDDPGASRLFELDVEKYGKSVVPQLRKYTYMQSKLLSASEFEDNSFIDAMNRISSILDGGLSFVLNASELDEREIYSGVLKAVQKLNFIKVEKEIKVCKNCGFKIIKAQERCPRCKSSASFSYLTSR